MFIENISRSQVETLVKVHSAFFKEIFYSRRVNNVYFDNINFDNFQDNIIGNMNRLKYRIRWYGEIYGEISKPKLELKIKKGLVGSKITFPLNKFVLYKGINISNIRNIVLDSKEVEPQVKEKIRSQLPVILNSYSRTYFESLDKKFRITIDDDQSFYKVNTFDNTFVNNINDKGNVILEIKYNKEDDILANKIIKELPFRISKSSKYSRGVEMFYV